MHLNHTSLAGSLTLALILPAPAFSVDAACQPILDANRAKFAAAAFHDTMYARADTKTPTGELIKVGSQAWMKAGKDWVAVPPAMLKKMQNFNAEDADDFGMHHCSQLSTSPNRVYTWDLKVEGKTYSGGKLTLSSGGLPIRTEAGSGDFVLTVYENVSAPKISK